MSAVESRISAAPLEGRSIRRAMRISGRSDGGIATGSTTPNTPSRAKIKPAWPRRTRLVSAEITGRDLAVGVPSPLEGEAARSIGGTRSERPPCS